MGSLLLADGPLFGTTSRGIIVFGFQIYYYAICIVTGIIVATTLSALLMKRRNVSPDFIFTLFIFCIPVALVCTRLFYCITDGMPIEDWFRWESIREGGLSVVGGAIGGVTTGFVVCKVKKIDFFRAADCVVITILVAQAIGRWGNYFNGEVYGGVVENESMHWFPFAVNIGGTWHYAFFFYESVVNLIGFSLLFSAAWFYKNKPNGLFTFAYFVWYGTVRTIMEPLRDPRYILSGGGVPWSLVFSVLMIVFGVGGIATLLFLNYKKEGSLLGSKKGDPCAIRDYLTADKEDVPYFSKINLMGANYPERPPEEPDPRTFREKAKDGFSAFLGLFRKKPEDEAEREKTPEATAERAESEEKEKAESTENSEKEKAEPTENSEKEKADSAENPEPRDGGKED